MSVSSQSFVPGSANSVLYLPVACLYFRTMKTIITIKEMLEYMSAGKAFALTYITYNRQRRKGGQIRNISEAVLLQEDQTDEGGLNLRKGRAPTTVEEMQARIAKARTRDPNHQHWYTRNIRILQDGHPTSLIKKVHPPLVIEFCGYTVVP